VEEFMETPPMDGLDDRAKEAAPAWRSIKVKTASATEILVDISRYISAPAY